MNSGVLIVGACQAGVQLATSLRDFGYDGPVTLVGAEPHLPYQRPPLSKSYLSLDAKPASLALRSEEFYRSRDVNLILGQRVTDVNLDRGVAVTDSGSALHFSQLALTTGARVRRLSIPGADLKGIYYLRCIDDAHELGGALAQAHSVAVVGGGVIGLEVASVARAAGKKVTVVEAAPRLVGRAVAPVVSEFLFDAHTRRGIDVRLSSTISAIEGEQGRATRLRLHDSSAIEADLVVVGIGVIPRTEIAEKLGLNVQGAIVVDQYARTSDERVVAAGDVTLLPSPLAPEVLIRLESVQNAIDQARTAAATLVGRLEPYAALPWSWSDQGDLKLQIAGLSAGYEEVHLRGDTDSDRFCAMYYRSNRLIAADCVNRPADFMAIRRALSSGATIPADRIGDESVALKTLISTTP